MSDTTKDRSSEPRQFSRDWKDYGGPSVWVLDMGDAERDAMWRDLNDWPKEYPRAELIQQVEQLQQHEGALDLISDPLITALTVAMMDALKCGYEGCSFCDYDNSHARDVHEREEPDYTAEQLRQQRDHYAGWPFMLRPQAGEPREDEPLSRDPRNMVGEQFSPGYEREADGTPALSDRRICDEPRDPSITVADFVDSVRHRGTNIVPMIDLAREINAELAALPPGHPDRKYVFDPGQQKFTPAPTATRHEEFAHYVLNMITHMSVDPLDAADRMRRILKRAAEMDLL